MSEKEIRAIAREIVAKSKADARVDTGRLKRSISYTINLNGVATFTEVFYGQFRDNSDLEENIKSMWPTGVPYQLIYTDDNGMPYQVIRKTARGRTAIETKATKSTTRQSLGINGIRNFLKGFTNGNKAEDTETDTRGQDN